MTKTTTSLLPWHELLATQRQGPVYCHDTHCNTKTGTSLLPWPKLLHKDGDQFNAMTHTAKKEKYQFIAMTRSATQRRGPVYCHDKHCYTKMRTSLLSWQILLHKDGDQFIALANTATQRLEGGLVYCHDNRKKIKLDIKLIFCGLLIC